ncbi:MAG: lipopolysaccharide assembly protein LapB [Thiobacillaceae bacterium]|nr:lipopolysaccharide assembly protein LapB [Thiobacillaceae bacterium]MCX7673789.1 lipopolysaccharide assembly protein LapB [Thiobacillaceae bacterium]MDW8323355.1 lipopolysaccharide assembly protein LapB [Burkholderiales bacterium]
MELEAWHLLALPLFFALGWLAARVDIRHVMRESRAVPASYFKGLNFLLNDQPDKAIDAFVEVARLDPDTLELHYALGALFRRRGELDRAIRIHRNLVERSDLSQREREKAQYELGQDFLKAGLLDRAEAIFKDLEQGVHAIDALNHLLDIYVLEKEWERAIATAERLERLGCPSRYAEIAHYHCELALDALLRQDVGLARQHLEQARAADRRSARAIQLAGDLELQEGRPEAAIAVWRSLEQANPDYLPLIAERLFQAYQQLGRPEEGIALLKAYHSRQPSADLFHILFNAVQQTQGWSAARALAAEALRSHANLLVLDAYLQACNATADEADLEARLAQDLVHQHAARLAYYRCRECGFRARQFFWQCPACARWESIPPRRLEHD